MYELVLKEKPTLLVWNYFELQVSWKTKELRILAVAIIRLILIPYLTESRLN